MSSPVEEDLGSVDLSRLTQIDALDGIRAGAIALVLAQHAFHVPGWFGVDVFFVLSGFLITRILLRTRSTPHAIRVFYARRVLRIFPVYYLFLGAWAALNPDVRSEVWFYALYLSDFVGLRGEPAFGMGHLWSLAVEEQFYFLWPALVMLLSRKSLVRLCVAALVYSLACRVAMTVGLGHEWLASTFPGLQPKLLLTLSIFTRADGIFAGAMLAIFVADGLRHNSRNRRLALVGMLAAMLGVLTLGVTGHFTWSRGGLPMAFFGLPSVVLGSVCFLWWTLGLSPDSRLERILTWGPVRYLGKISYGVYLFHLPILALSDEHIDPLVDPRFHSLVAAGMVILSILVAAASWHLFESPINRLKRRWSYQESPRSA